MIASSAFVLAALTMTGVYMKERNSNSQNDGYIVDFTALENDVEDKFQEIAQNDTDMQDNAGIAAGNVSGTVGNQTNMEDDLDYMPMEAGSHLVEIPGLTDGMYSLNEENMEAANGNAESEADSAEPSDGPKELDEGTARVNEETDSEYAADTDSAQTDEATAGQNVEVSKELHFSEENGLVRPTSGDIIMHYSMDSTVYFTTLKQYKYNSAVVFYADEGSAVTACAEGKVINIFDDARIGHAVTVDLGDGYQATYGQLKDVQVALDSYVNSGDIIGSIAAPTKYYTLEGSNLYFQLTKDGTPVNPENLF